MSAEQERERKMERSGPENRMSESGGVRKLNERERSGAGAERERGVKKYGGAGRSRSGSGAVSGGYRKRRER